MKRGLVTTGLVLVACVAGILCAFLLEVVASVLFGVDTLQNRAAGQLIAASWLPFAVLFCWLLLRRRSPTPQSPDPAVREAWERNRPQP